MKLQINIGTSTIILYLMTWKRFFDSARLVNFRSLMKHSDEPWNALISEQFGQFSIFEMPVLSPVRSEMCKVFITLLCFSVSLIHRLYCTFFNHFWSISASFPVLLNHFWWLIIEWMTAMHVLHFVICVWLELIEGISSHLLWKKILSKLKWCCQSLAVCWFPGDRFSAGVALGRRTASRAVARTAGFSAQEMVEKVVFEVT